MARGFPQAPRWAWISMTAGVIALVVLGYFAMNRPEPPAPTARASADEPTAAGPARILVIGDSYTGGSDEGGQGAADWAALIDADLADATVDTSTAGGSGYVARGPSGNTFPDLIDAADGGFDVVVFFGSRNDQAPASEVRTSAEAAFRAAQASSPDAQVLVIGPPWVDAQPPGFITADRDAVHEAAEAVGATWVDPLADGWFVDRPELIGSDGVHPTDAGHRYMADLILPAVTAVLAEVRTAG